MEKTTQELLQECRTDIKESEEYIEWLQSKMDKEYSKLENFKSKELNYLNYLNSDND